MRGFKKLLALVLALCVFCTGCVLHREPGPDVISIMDYEAIQLGAPVEDLLAQYLPYKVHKESYYREYTTYQWRTFGGSHSYIYVDVKDGIIVTKGWYLGYSPNEDINSKLDERDPTLLHLGMSYDEVAATAGAQGYLREISASLINTQKVSAVIFETEIYVYRTSTHVHTVLTFVDNALAEIDCQCYSDFVYTATCQPVRAHDFQLGMSYEQAVAILGSEGDLSTWAETAERELLRYRWKETGIGEAAVSATFVNGQLTYFQRQYIQPDQEYMLYDLTLPEQLEKGMTVSEVQAILGLGYIYNEVLDDKGITIDYRWDVLEPTDNYLYYYCVFVNGKLTYFSRCYLIV